MASACGKINDAAEFLRHRFYWDERGWAIDIKRGVFLEMKVLVLGGAGFESGGIINDLIKSRVPEIVLADYQNYRMQKNVLKS